MSESARMIAQAIAKLAARIGRLEERDIVALIKERERGRHDIVKKLDKILARLPK